MTRDQALRTALATLIRERSVQTGTFTLASGRQSGYYIDARRTTMSAEGFALIGQLGLEAIRAAGLTPSVVGGLTLGADPVAYAVARASRDWPPTIDAFTVRKGPKGHGARRQIEGCFKPGAAVVIVEDVVTSGQSALSAAEAVLNADGAVLAVLAVVDREEGGKERIVEAGFPLIALLTPADLGLPTQAAS